MKNNKYEQFLKTSDYNKGRLYPKDYIKLNSKSNDNSNNVLYNFRVRSEQSYRTYEVNIFTKFNKICEVECSCPQYFMTGSCKHIGACLYFNQDLFNNLTDKEIKEKNSNYILNILKSNNLNKINKKEEVFIEPIISIFEGYYNDGFLLKARIGKDKKYSLIGKFNGFIDAYDNNRSFKFGANYTYDGNSDYFSDTSERFIEFIRYIRHYSRVDGNNILLNENDIKMLFHIFPEGIYYENKFVTIKQTFPINVKLTQKDNYYYLNANRINLYKLTNDCEYVLADNEIYHLNPNERLFLSNWIDSDYMELVYTKEQFDDIQKNILGLIKEKLLLDKTTKDIIINVKPEVKLYFDLTENVICNPIFTYNDIETNYFENKINVVRDTKYEDSIIDELKAMNFIIEKNKLILKDFDLIVDFMENELDSLAQKFAVFTTEKIKNTNIIKNNKVTSTFSIGKDNILRYEFDLGAISDDEINKVMQSLENKKKYYKLKNGDILYLQNDSLKELNDLKNELELTDKDIKSGGIIPKYQALYLDSLKENKYEIINTNDNFNNFINNFKEFHKVKLNFSKDENNLLRDYQKQGVKWLYTIHKCNFGGILADEMGLGKSLQTIIFFKKLLKENKNAKFLICCPTSLSYNWLNEFNKFAKELNVAVFSENKNIRKDKLKNYNGNIYITSYGLLREDINFYKDINFEVFVIDEAQNIKNPQTGIAKSVKEINAFTKLALTGTPIENSIIELWSIFDFIMPGFLSNQNKFQKKYKIKEFDEETNKLLSELKQLVKPFILRRKKENVIKDLPKKIENNIYLDMTIEQKKYYISEVEYVNNQMQEMLKDGGFKKNKMLILRLLTRLRQICINPKIIYDNYEGDNCKISNLIKIIKELVDNNHKILLFTSFKTALLMVKEELDKVNITNYTIAGDVPSKKRQELVDKFNKDNTNVFLIMLKSGGTGLNLTSADVVIHLDLWWNPQTENQATDRTHRIGQTKTVEVIKLICKGTIEEKIIELQEKKKLLSDKILENNMSDSKVLEKLTEKDIKYMLSYENKE